MKLLLFVLLPALANSGAAPPPGEVCLKPMPANSCDGNRFVYNAANQRCERSCQGDFASLKECHERCGSSGSKSGHVRQRLCFEGAIKNNGPNLCRAAFLKYTFDPKTLDCKKYIYGGCNGGDNLFETAAECLQACTYSHGVTKTPKSLDDAVLVRSYSGSDLPPQARSFDFDAADSNDLGDTDDVCHLPPIKGRCRAFFPRFHYNPDANKCELFVYGGCGGNGNNFKTTRSCKAACIHDQRKQECNPEKCNKSEIGLNAAKGCKPVIKRGECCPSSWDCSRWTERLARKSECFLANSKIPSGKFYASNDPVPEAESGCRTSCVCSLNPVTGFGEVNCATVDCPDTLPLNADQCSAIVSTYDGSDQCCPSRTECYKAGTPPYACELEGQSYVRGQYMYPDREPCQVCHCQEGWINNATEENSRFCRRVDCPMPDFNIHDGCKPVYTAGVCCPTSWECPERTPEVAGSVICPPGVQPNLDYQDYLDPEVEADSPELHVCLQPKSVGPCQGYLDKWFFDASTSSCQAFKYGDQRNYGNVFDSLEDCATTCAEFVAPPAAASRSAKLFSTGRVCSLPKETGPCRALFRRWHFDFQSGRCKQFIYGGCDGNDNRFETKDHCLATCNGRASRSGVQLLRARSSLPVPEVEETDELLSDAVVVKALHTENDKCSQPIQSGRCLAYFPRYAYDSQQGKCVNFIYGGCGGNDNRFESMEECSRECSGTQDVDQIKEWMDQKCNEESQSSLVVRQGSGCKIIQCNGRILKIQDLHNCQII